jgi:hypothetical protein
VVAADQRVVLVVEEVGVTEVERQALMPAGVDVAVDGAAIAHREGIASHAVEHHLETDALTLAEAAGVGKDEHGSEGIHAASIRANSSPLVEGSWHNAGSPRTKVGHEH